MRKRSNRASRVFASLVGSALLVGATFALTSDPAQAKKCFAEATGFPCKKCHNSPTGGKDEGWNAFGQKYKKTVVDAGKAPC